MPTMEYLDSHLNAKIRDTIDKMSLHLVSTSSAINRAILARKDTREDEIKKASAEYNQLRHFFVDHRIYLDRETVKIVNGVLITWRQMFYELWSHLDSDIDFHSWTDAQDKLLEFVHDNINPTIENLTCAFRDTIGTADEQETITNL